MAGGAELTALALNAVFRLCVPGVSQGKLEQTLPTEILGPLTDEQKTEYADAIKADEQAYRIISDVGFILVTTEGGFCSVTTGDGDSGLALKEFRKRLKEAGGTEDGPATEKDGYVLVNGMIQLTEGDAVALVFSAPKSGDLGFFASAFGVHKGK